jgi:hypothetical protein
MIDIKICDCVADGYERVYKKALLEHVKTRVKESRGLARIP